MIPSENERKREMDRWMDKQIFIKDYMFFYVN